MSNPELAGWGALGAFIAYLVIFVLPEAVKAARGDQTAAVTFARFMGNLIVALIFVGVGAALTVALSGATDVAAALTFGLSVESIAGGSLKGFLPAT